MKYILLVYHEENHWSTEERASSFSQSLALCEQLRSKGILLDASPLKPTTCATSVRIRMNQRWIADGPFATTDEQLCEYFLIEAKDLDQAIEVASTVPGIHHGTVEIRPIVDLGRLP